MTEKPIEPVATVDSLPSTIKEELADESGKIHEDGRIQINMESKVAKALGKSIDMQEEMRRSSVDWEKRANQGETFNLKLNIVIQIVGSRGDVQPFVALGCALQKDGHRVRIATHDVFVDFIHGAGLEFFPIGGDPADLMAYMVKNPGLLPQMKTLREGEIAKKKRMVGVMLDGCWRSCIEEDPYTQRPFVADAIIANPPSFAHIHCAQALGIPVHLMFTMPWSSTKAFPHPLSSIKIDKDSPNRGRDCWVSYGVVEWLTWQGLSGVINRWRETLDLEPIPTTEGPSLHETLKIPFTYCWSPALVPKPRDWPEYVDVVGFFFREAPDYKPFDELKQFLDAGDAPVYIGFGSIVVEDPQKLIDTVLAAVKKSGARAIVSKGWSNMNGEENENIFFIGDCPHEWLFQHVAGVVHHGGAGTTACGLLNGRPTSIVPFFGDQPFWGEMVANAGAGPKPIPYADLTVENLTDAIEFLLTPEAATAAAGIAEKMKTESGVTEAVKSFYRNLPMDVMRCEIMNDQMAVWSYKKIKPPLKLSKAAVQTLIERHKIKPEHLQCYEIEPIVIDNHRWGPLSGVASAALSTTRNHIKQGAGIFTEPVKEYTRSKEYGYKPPPPPSKFYPQVASADIGDGQSMVSESTTLSAEEAKAQHKGRSGLSTAGHMVGASAGSLGGLTKDHFKGIFIDIPMAATDGFRNVSNMYGDRPKNYGAVSDWKSGAKVGSKVFVGDMTEAVTGLVKHPWRGFRKEGTLGAVKGLGKGGVGLFTKASSATLSIWAYPSQGITRSLESQFKSKTRKSIVTARLLDGYAQTIAMDMSEDMKTVIVKEFDGFMKKK